MNWESFAAAIGFLGVLCAIFVGLSGWLRGREQRAKEYGSMRETLVHIHATVLEIRTEQKEQQSDLTRLNQRVSMLEHDIQAAVKLAENN